MKSPMKGGLNVHKELQGDLFWRSSLLVLGILAVLWPVSFAVGQPEAIEVRVEAGTRDGRLRFVPDKFRFQRGKYYKLIVHNPSPQAHYFTSDGLATRVFTRKVEFIDGSGNTVAEVHGDIRDMELLPGATLAWYFYPMTKGKGLRLYCHKEGHTEAGMAGEIEIFGPPPLSN